MIEVKYFKYPSHLSRLMLNPFSEQKNAINLTLACGEIVRYANNKIVLVLLVPWHFAHVLKLIINDTATVV